MEKHLSPRPTSSGPALPSIGWFAGPDGSPPHMADVLSRHGYTLTDVQADTPGNCQIVIVDCRHVSLACAQNFLSGLYSGDTVQSIALYGVPARSGYEQLVSWPMVKGIFPNECNNDHLIKGISLMLTGENWFPRRILDDWLERQRNTMVPPILTQNLPELTDRERQILWHIDMASTNAQIAFSLSISEHTVKTHIYNIFRKISVRNRTQASNWVKANLRKVEA